MKKQILLLGLLPFLLACAGGEPASSEESVSVSYSYDYSRRVTKDEMLELIAGKTRSEFKFATGSDRYEYTNKSFPKDNKTTFHYYALGRDKTGETPVWKYVNSDGSYTDYGGATRTYGDSEYLERTLPGMIEGFNDRINRPWYWVSVEANAFGVGFYTYSDDSRWTQTLFDRDTMLPIEYTTSNTSGTSTQKHTYTWKYTDSADDVQFFRLQHRNDTLN